MDLHFIGLDLISYRYQTASRVMDFTVFSYGHIGSLVSIGV